MKVEKEGGRRVGKKLGGERRERKVDRERRILEGTPFEKVKARVYSARFPHWRYQGYS